MALTQFHGILADLPALSLKKQTKKTKIVPSLMPYAESTLPPDLVSVKMTFMLVGWESTKLVKHLNADSKKKRTPPPAQKNETMTFCPTAARTKRKVSREFATS